MWSIGVDSSSKNLPSRSKSVASKAAVLSAPTLLAALWRRSGFLPVRITFAPSARARRAVSSPMPALPPITTTVCPRSSGSRRMGETVVAVLMISSDQQLKIGHCGFECEYLANVAIGGTSLSSASDARQDEWGLVGGASATADSEVR